MTYHVHAFSDILGLQDALDDINEKIGDEIETQPPDPPPTPNPEQHSHWLDNLVNVDIDFPPDDNAVLSYDSATGYWGWEETLNTLATNESWPTGLIDGGELNIGPGVNDIEVIAGEGVIMDSYTDPESLPTSRLVSWGTINAPITAAPAVAGSVVWFFIATDGVTPGPVPNTTLGTLVQQATAPSQSQYRDAIQLGVAIHNGDEWGEISSPIVINNAAHTLNEYLDAVAGPTFIIDGGGVTEQPLFTLNQDAGTVWEQNRNWHVDKKNPNRETFAARTPMQFRYTNRDFSTVGALTSTVVPTDWDNAGTVEPVGGGAARSTIQRVFIDPRDNIWILYGQNVYASWSEALSLIGQDEANTVIPFQLQQSFLLGYIVSEHTKVDWDANEAVFVEAGTGGGGGGGVGFTPTTFNGPLTTGYVPDPLTAEQRVLTDSGLWDWRGFFKQYTAGATYFPQDFVYEGGWQMVANTTTTDYPAPTPVGDPTESLPDAPAFQEFSNVSVVGSGHYYTFTVSGYYRGLRVWVPETSPDITYNVNIVRNPNSANPQYGVVSNPILDAGGWTTLDVDTVLVLEGEELLVYIEALNSGGSVSPGGTPADWFRAVSSNTALPLAGEWNTNIQESILRINEDDADANPPIDFNGVIPGSTFEFVSTADPTVSITYTAISSETYDAVNGVYEWVVSITSTGAGGAPQPADRTIGTIIVPVAAATKFVGIPAYWNAGTFPTWATVISNLQYDGVDQPVVGDEAYGVDIAFQELSKSDDWDIYGVPASGGGGGGTDPTPPSGGGSTEATITQAGHGFVELDCIRWDGAAWVKAQADDANTTALGVVFEVVDSSTFKYAITGRYDVAAHGLLTDEWYYLSDTVAGDLTATEPEISQPIVYVEDADTVSIYAYRPAVSAFEVVPPKTRAVKTEIARPDPVGGSFDFSGLNLSGYDRVYIEFNLRSTVAGVADDLLLYYNGDTTDANYYHQRNISRAGTGLETEGATANIAILPGASSPANSYASGTIAIDNTVSSLQSAYSTFSGYANAGATLYVGLIAQSHETSTDPITQIELLSGLGGNLTGTAILYGEKTEEIGGGAGGGGYWEPAANPDDITNTNSGNVCIGTATPENGAILHAAGHIQVGGTDSNQDYPLVRITSPIGQGDMAWQVFGAGLRLYDFIDSAERMRIDSDGKVGIGTGTPVDLNGSKRLLTLESDYARTALVDSVELGENALAVHEFFGSDRNRTGYVGTIPGSGCTVFSQIGPAYIYADAAKVATFTAGQVLINREAASPTTPSATLQVQANNVAALAVYNASTTGGNGCQFWLSDVGGTETSKAQVDNNGAFVQLSDYRDKTTDGPYVGALAKIAKIPIYNGRMKWESPDDNRPILLAHEVQEQLPYFVNGEKDGKHRQMVQYAALTTVLISAVQELTERLEALENKP